MVILLHLLLEEVQEVESIYHAINEQILHSCGNPYLRGLIEAIKSEVKESLDDLKWIRQFAVRMLQAALQKNRKTFKKLYTSTIQILYAIKNKAIVLSQLTDIVTLYDYLTRNVNYRTPLTALEKFIDNIKSHLKGSYSVSQLNLYVLAEYSYSTINILRKRNTIVFCVPVYDLFKPWKWVLLLHEIGHILFDIKSEIFVNEFRKRILPLLKQLTPTGYRHLDQILRLWEQKWLKELIADLYGVALGGPSYIYAFLIEVFSSNPASPTISHPSLDSRIHIQLKYLENIAEVQEWLERIRGLWLSYRENILIEKLSYPFTPDVLDELNTIFTGITKNPLFLSYISEVLEIQRKISKGYNVVAEPLYLILALTLSDKKMDTATWKRVINAIAEDQ